MGQWFSSSSSTVTTATVVEAGFTQLVAYAKEVLAKQFSAITVNKAEVKKAESALKKVNVTNYEEGMVHDITTGLEKKDLDRFCNLLVKSLRLTEEKGEELKDNLMMLEFVKSKQAAVDTVKLDLEGYSSVYGFIAGVPEKDGGVTVVYAFYKLVFSLPEGKVEFFDAAEVDAIKNHYCKNKALMTLKQENVIQSISYE